MKEQLETGRAMIHAQVQDAEQGRSGPVDQGRAEKRRGDQPDRRYIDAGRSTTHTTQL